MKKFRSTLVVLGIGICVFGSFSCSSKHKKTDGTEDSSTASAATDEVPPAPTDDAASAPPADGTQVALDGTPQTNASKVHHKRHRKQPSSETTAPAPAPDVANNAAPAPAPAQAPPASAPAPQAAPAAVAPAAQQNNIAARAPVPNQAAAQGAIPRPKMAPIVREPAAVHDDSDEPFYMKPTFLGGAALILALATASTIMGRKKAES